MSAFQIEIKVSKASIHKFSKIVFTGVKIVTHKMSQMTIILAYTLSALFHMLEV